MKKSSILACALGAAVLVLESLFFVSQEAQARLTGTNPTGASADAWCVGAKGNETCVDARGNVIPTTDNRSALGSTSLRFSSANIAGTSIFSGNIQAGTSDGGDTFTLNAGTVIVRNLSTAVKVGTSTTDTVYILSVDGANRRLGIGVNAPGADLSVKSSQVYSTATIINTPASPTADIQEWQVNGSTVARVGPQGHVGLRRYLKAAIDLLVPDFFGAEIICIDCTLPYSLCTSTGNSAAQWRVSYATSSTAGTGVSVGCGTNN